MSEFQFFMDRAQRDFSRSLEQKVVGMLRDNGYTIAVAESVTGGLVSRILTNMPGSSDYFIGGAVCYSPRAKVIQTGIEPKIIAEYGVVSEETAIGLARGIRQRLVTTLGVGITGVAGPEAHGGRPVGTVFIALSDKKGDTVKEFLFDGDRAEIQQRTAEAVFGMLMVYGTGEEQTIEH